MDEATVLQMQLLRLQAQREPRVNLIDFIDYWIGDTEEAEA